LGDLKERRQGSRKLAQARIREGFGLHARIRGLCLYPSVARVAQLQGGGCGPAETCPRDTSQAGPRPTTQSDGPHSQRQRYLCLAACGSPPLSESPETESARASSSAASARSFTATRMFARCCW